MGIYGSTSVPKKKLNWLRDVAVIGADAHTHSPYSNYFYYFYI